MLPPSWPATLASAALLAFAGCMGSPADDDAAGPATDADVDGSPTPMVPPGAEAPSYEPGDWWRWSVEGRGYAAFEMTTVVADADEDQVAFAVTDAHEAMPAHILHVPPVGVAGSPDLQWLAHGEPMDLLRFPLENGKTWTGSIDGQAIGFTATALEGPAGGDAAGEAHTVFAVDGRFVEHGGQGPRFVYDPMLRMFSEVHIHYGGDEPFSSARVVASGTGHAGDVAVHEPRDKFLGGSGGLADASPPLAQFQAESAKAWLVFGCYLGGSTGRFEIQYLPPVSNEEPMQCGFVNDGVGFEDQVQVMWRSSVPGAWNVLFGVVGDGYAEAEVIGVLERACHVGDGESQVPPC